MAEPVPRLRVILRPMRMEDIDQVLEMDRLSFPTPWPARTYQYEIADNDRAKMFVIEPVDGTRKVTAEKPHSSWLERLFSAGKNGNGASARRLLYGYSGMWHIADEAHVSTIATHPRSEERRVGKECRSRWSPYH